MKSTAIPYSIGNIGEVFAAVLEPQEGRRQNVLVYAASLGYGGLSADRVEIVKSTVLKFTINERTHWVPVTSVLALTREEDEDVVIVHLVSTGDRPRP